MVSTNSRCSGGSGLQPGAIARLKYFADWFKKREHFLDLR